MADFGRALKQLRDRDRQPYLTGLNPVANISLSTQLQFLKARPSMRYVPVNSSSHRLSLPFGEVESTPFGSHYVVRKTFAHNHDHGKVRLSRFSVPELQTLMAVMKQRATAGDRDRILFLDTETTGIQGGAGICPFMVGAGHFSGDDFQMHQYFIRDFDEESSMLYSLAELLRNFDLVVTYNGASFDIPLLESRFTLARCDNPFQAMAHFDLLNTARRLWRNGHGSCRLVALERLLAFERGPDIPGAKIPRVYFDYLQQGPSAELTSVFTHNVYDIMSLAALTVLACDRVAAEPAALDDPLDLYSLARILEDSSDWRRTVELYEQAITGGLPESFRVKALENLSVIYRRSGDPVRSFQICEELMKSEIFSLAAYEGAAVYHERCANNMEAALKAVETGIARLQDFGGNKRWKGLLQSRWERLQQKVIGFPSLETS